MALTKAQLQVLRRKEGPIPPRLWRACNELKAMRLVRFEDEGSTMVIITKKGYKELRRASR